MRSSAIGLLCMLWCSGCRYDSLVAVHYHAAERPVVQAPCTTQPADAEQDKTVSEIVKEYLR
jgi:hypothetical protein